MMGEDFALGKGWVCQDGLVSATPKICAEYTEKRNIQPVRVAFFGPPKSGKSTLAALVAKHFNIVVCRENNSANTCRYRGFVIDGATMEEVQQLENRIDFVIFMQSAKETCIQRGSTEEEYTSWVNDKQPELVQYFIDKLDEKPEEPVEGEEVEGGEPAPAKPVAEEVRDPQDILYLPHRAGKTPEESMECVRIFVEGGKRHDNSRGRPKNYGIQTEEEVNKEQREIMESRMAEARKSEEAALREKEEKENAMVVADMDDELVAMLDHHLIACDNLNSIPTRTYLLDNVIPSITEGLIHITQIMPEDPIDSLADFLEKCAASKT